MYAVDTIAALATPPGVGGIGIVRISGPGALQIATAMFQGRPDNDWASHRLYHGAVRDLHGRTLDDGLAALMRAPHSYTGEDVLELHCHGSPVVLRRVLATALALGARLAEPGEFTRRAFLNGRIDLAQAEAVIELIRAHTDEGAALATDQLLGRLSHALSDARENLIQIRASLEVQIDFSEDDVMVDQVELSNMIEAAQTHLLALLESYRHGQLVRDGLQVVIAGKPNVGKSSLLNALLSQERVIVTAVPGTTRDIVEESVDFGGIPVRLSDTAGLRDAGDPVEEIGVSRARAKIVAVDVVIAVFDTSRPFDDLDEAMVALLANRRVVAALNKSDLPSILDAAEVTRRLGNARLVRLSALHGEGLDDLRRAVLRIVEDDGEPSTDQPTVILARHFDALTKAADSLRLALGSIRAQAPPDLIAIDVQAATDHIATITGAITSEDVLDRIFAEFCIGK
ncbi:MAG: tRNA uridine-5-carboxymethylaminomethyl(34) synthesis GTPase MnmE [Deltaproteobacteria bacterium]|nr:tRNA uridine-5-carboxymethylaminomethyl(34) synthesis GTPase MnmE [Deltaproteobacteria bacterium]MBI3390665.1 tRNA uridine-5-carboxymethylaminomethyl(34) synthesis GTPase MnmE [Deltaproteobacteria bacterium]